MQVSIDNLTITDQAITVTHFKQPAIVIDVHRVSHVTFTNAGHTVYILVERHPNVVFETIELKQYPDTVYPSILSYHIVESRG